MVGNFRAKQASKQAPFAKKQFNAFWRLLGAFTT